jgi:hypothetical protein
MGQIESTPTSAVLNLVYAIHYPVKSSHLPQSTIIAIGVGSGIAGLLILALLGCLIWKCRRPNRVAQLPASASPAVAEPPNTTVMPAETVPVHEYWQKPSPQATFPAYAQVPQNAQMMAYAPVPQMFPPGGSPVATYPGAPQTAPPPPMAYPVQIAPSPPYPGAPQTAPPPPMAYPVQIAPSPPLSNHTSNVLYPPSVSPVQSPQELHDPNWAGRHELQSPN